MHYKTLIETEWLGQWDLPNGRDVVVRIAKVERYTPEVRKKKRRADGTYEEERNKRIAISFHGKRKRWLAGPVSQAAIAKMYGNNVERWIDATIALYVDPDVRMGNDVVGGIRVRPTIPRAKETADDLDRAPPPEKVEQLERAREHVDGGEPLHTRQPGEEG
jgi:hypothetical protein